MSSEQKKYLILVVDDSEINRIMLMEMLKNSYDIIEASNGEEAIALIKAYGYKIDLILLDIVMPVMDGFQMLRIMNQNDWINHIPVIMISAESDDLSIKKAYDLGVTDYIQRPYRSYFIHKRIDNTLKLYSKQKILLDIAKEQVFQKEKDSRMMINILGHIVEFRNSESGMHVHHIQTITRLILRNLVSISDKYNLSDNDILQICTASALHDIGKITIDDKILNKPGKLTKEEFEIMKTHTSAGAEMLKELPIYQKKTLVNLAYQICRWHHERYDGKGYPDGLKGEEIPISAQVVSIADVYDALTSERCYKKAFSHEKAMEMIFDGQCGTFNPLLLECLKNIQNDIADAIQADELGGMDKQMLSRAAEEIVEDRISDESVYHSQLLADEQAKRIYFTQDIKEIQFEYDSLLETIILSEYGAKFLGMKNRVIYPHQKENDFLGESRAELIERLHKTTFQNPDIEPFEAVITYNGITHKYRIMARSLWSGDNRPKYTGAIGRIIDLNILRRNQ